MAQERWRKRVTMISSNATLWDRVRTLVDFSAWKGHLDPQDGFEDPTPMEALRATCEAQGWGLVDHRQTPRRGRGRARGTRKIEDIYALWYHQTGCLISSEGLSIPAHSLILRRTDTRPTTIVLLHPIRAYLYGSHHANPFAITIEVEACAAGVSGDPRTLWTPKGKTVAEHWAEASEDQIMATRIVGQYYIDEVAAQDGAVTHSGNHRNSHKSRVSDPGQEIATRCTRYHGLLPGPVIGSGRPDPTVWGGDEGIPYSWRVRGW